MADKDLKRYPHHVRACSDLWWYEEPEGMVLVRSKPVGANFVTIPWGVIRRALARKDAPTEGDET